MVLLRRGIALISQDEMGESLGLIVPKKYKKILPLARTGKKPIAGWGTQVQREEYSINNFFKKHNISLKEEYFPLSRVNNVADWIRKQIKKDNDILICFRYGKMYGGKGEGHVSVIDSISEDNAVLIDPASNVPKYRKVKLANLIKAIDFHGEGARGGFWLITKK